MMTKILQFVSIFANFYLSFYFNNGNSLPLMLVEIHF